MFAETEVGEFDVSGGIEEDVVGLQIAMNIFHAVNGVEGK